jgi:Tol biopolymer transport system component
LLVFVLPKINNPPPPATTAAVIANNVTQQGLGVDATATFTQQPSATLTPSAQPTTAVPTTVIPTTAVPTTAIPTTGVPTTAVPPTTPPPKPTTPSGRSVGPILFKTPFARQNLTRYPKGQIAFDFSDGDSTDLYLLDINLLSQTQISFSPQNENHVAWSPNGKYIVYSRQVGVNNWDIFWAYADGGSPKQLTDSPGLDLNPTWSPDGQYIVYASDQKSRRGNFGIYRINADGSDMQRLTGESVNANFPTFSPDGRKLAYVSGDGTLINILTIDSGRAAIAVKVPDQIYNLVFSPKGDKIAFSMGYDRSADVCVYNLGSPTIVNLTKRSGYDANPTWSPDGQWLAFESDRTGSSNLFVMTSDGKNVLQLTYGESGTYAEPSWRP